MAGELTTSTTVRDKVVERIRSSFVDLIPEDQWKEMVSTEIHTFTAPQDSGGYRRERVSNLQTLIHDALVEIFRERLVAEFAKPEYATGPWSDLGGREPGDFLKAFLSDNCSLIVKEAVGCFTQNILDAVQSRMTQPM